MAKYTINDDVLGLSKAVAAFVGTLSGVKVLVEGFTGVVIGFEAGGTHEITFVNNCCSQFWVIECADDKEAFMGTGRDVKVADTNGDSIRVFSCRE
jgi:hypothetical protein